MVVGGATPRQPVLRRPDLLKSLVLHWQRHPSLLHSFSGLFIGPTSQAPRTMKRAMTACTSWKSPWPRCRHPGEGVPPLPWPVDRLFRNLLVDVTGNTQSLGICIDKLFSPDGPTGRFGLVEFRGFEMPPNARMSLAQHSLVRALIARFWKNPVSGKPFVRWGTRLLTASHAAALHLDLDFLDVLADLRENGFDLKPEWFVAQLEFRFPSSARWNMRALSEPRRHWNPGMSCVGEQGAIGGTVRYVDPFSVERLQVRLETTNPARRSRVLQWRAVPLKPTANPAFLSQACASLGVAAGSRPAPGAAGQLALNIRYL